MPRLTENNYVSYRRFLCQEWNDHDGVAFADLPLQHQLDLHDYFAPSVPFTDKEALRHRSAMTKAFPSLPQKAGRALQAIRAAAKGAPNQIVATHRSKTTGVVTIAGTHKSLRIDGVARPKPDHRRIARALVALARSEVDGKLLARAKKLRDRRSR